MAMVNVMIVDDSAVVRKVLTDVLSADAGINVIGTAADPIFALRRMEGQWPDVIVLDIEMPRMDGLTFLGKLMAEHPTPVVICSSLTERGAETTMQALSAGAVEVITKPRVGAKAFFEEDAAALIRIVKSAAKVRLDRVTTNPPVGRAISKERDFKALGGPLRTTSERIVAIGTSTGGTQALEVVLTHLPRISPGIVVVQHMPEKFTAAFAERLNRLSAIDVREARDGDRVTDGVALIAPGGQHMALVRRGARYSVEIKGGPLVNRHRPSVDVLFRSAAQWAGANALGIIMTGMGDDGAEAIGAMQRAGAHTIAQDEASCVVFGMPKEAIRRGYIDEVAPLHKLAGAIVNFASERACV